MGSSGLSHALRNIVREFPYHLENLYVFLSEVVTTVVIPLATIIAATLVSWKLSHVILRIMFPPNAAVLQK
jgi:K+-transporting ATPase A subunit